MPPEAAAPAVLRVLTLNLHCWQEPDALAKLERVADLIASEQVDVVCLQEVAQHVEAPIVGVRHGADIRADNAALVIAERLEREHAVTCDWAWTMAHLGFEAWEEGVAVLTRGGIARVETPFVSRHQTPAAWNARRLLAADVSVQGIDLTVVSAHLSWWEDAEEPFRAQWERVEQVLGPARGPLLLAGDLNVRDDGPGYAHVMRSRQWRDLHAQASAPARPGGTFAGDIAGWAQAEPGRIDYLLGRGEVQAVRARTVFDTVETAVSDHFGLLLDIAIAGQ